MQLQGTHTSGAADLESGHVWSVLQLSLCRVAGPGSKAGD